MNHIVDSAHILQKAALKVTGARIAILDVFLSEKGPLDAEDVSKRLRKHIDAVTVYRNINAFARKGIIKKIYIGKNAAQYEFPHSHHHHIVCRNCGAMEEFDFCAIETLINKVSRASRTFAEVNDHSLELFGVCKKCVC